MAEEEEEKDHFEGKEYRSRVRVLITLHPSLMRELSFPPGSLQTQQMCNHGQETLLPNLTRDQGSTTRVMGGQGQKDRDYVFLTARRCPLGSLQLHFDSAVTTMAAPFMCHF